MEILVLDGPTGSGKSALLQHIRKVKYGSFSTPKKLTTRKQRGAGDNDHRFVNSIPKENRFLRYEDVGATYAIDLEEIESFRFQNVKPIVTCTHTRTIEELKKRFSVKVIFVYRPADKQFIHNLMSHRGVTDSLKIEDRLSEISNLANRYAERILLYDHVILNIGRIELLFRQMDEILLFLLEKR